MQAHREEFKNMLLYTRVRLKHTKISSGYEGKHIYSGFIYTYRSRIQSRTYRSMLCIQHAHVNFLVPALKCYLGAVLVLIQSARSAPDQLCKLMSCIRDDKINPWIEIMHTLCFWFFLKAREQHLIRKKNSLGLLNVNTNTRDKHSETSCKKLCVT